MERYVASGHELKRLQGVPPLWEELMLGTPAVQKGTFKPLLSGSVGTKDHKNKSRSWKRTSETWSVPSNFVIVCFL
ncbi:hypothetical protein P7K49_009095 [Saguinus oedipus]|uniref:Uncharacterized protein n=1 Tax=Saguinus oedipus TaxID=9490 RepID=A0ABQ9VZM7_SAGOE|nr:hypothetical protein P7K49_009095 [Saguinus oedipus]